LDETFAIYAGHLRGFALLVAIVQTPISLVTLLIFQLFGIGVATISATAVLGIFGTVFIYGAVVCAVGQHYIAGGIKTRVCYASAWRRAVSLGTLAAIAVAVLVVVATLSRTSESVGMGVALLLIFPAIVLAGIYWSVAVQAVMVERYKAIGALRRSIELIRGSWWRVLGITLVIMLAAFGLALLISFPFAIASSVGGLGQESVLVTGLKFVGGLIEEIVVPPVVFIAGTLLYYDLRVRKEKYDLPTMSREMGLTAV
jgi:hypothetical protein